MKKQKLPKHIIAFEDLLLDVAVVLRHKRTGKCHSTDKDSESIRNAVKLLNRGEGWSKDETVGKQIVF